MRGLRWVREVGRSFGSGFERALLRRRAVAPQLERGYFSSSPHKSHRVWLDWLPGGKMICISLYPVVGKLRGAKIRLFAVDTCSHNEGFSHLFVQEAALSGFLFNWWHKIHTPPFGRMIQQDFSSELSLVWLSKCQDEAGVPLGSGQQHQLPVFQTALVVLLLPYIRSSQAICFIFLILFGDMWKISVPESRACSAKPARLLRVCSGHAHRTPLLNEFPLESTVCIDSLLKSSIIITVFLVIIKPYISPATLT